MKRPLVLVVDDVADNREMYLEYLKYVGFRVAGATNGEEAVELARKLQPAVILMDMSLPGTDGFEATRILKNDPATCDIVIIALTGHIESTHRARALLAGCDVFVPKPCLPEEIARRISHVLGRAASVR